MHDHENLERLEWLMQRMNDQSSTSNEIVSASLEILRAMLADVPPHVVKHVASGAIRIARAIVDESTSAVLVSAVDDDDVEDESALSIQSYSADAATVAGMLAAACECIEDTLDDTPKLH